jgi:hypothetical protein
MTVEFQDISEPTLKQAPPVLPWEVFADWIHVQPGIVRGWIDRGYLPTVRTGKHLMVNVELYRKQLLEKED